MILALISKRLRRKVKNGGLEVIKSNRLPDKKEDSEELGPENSIELQKIIEPFPSENPNPVLRVEKNGKVLYANRAACCLLEHWGIKEGEELPQSLRHSIRRVISQKTPENLEINIENTTYALKLCPHSEDECTDIYGFDISYRVRAEDKFRSHHERLEKLVELRTLEYIEANEKLAKEITERKRIEKTLQNNVQFLETLLDSIPSPVFQRDLNEIYVNCNESFARQIMGLPKEMVRGGSFSEFQKRVPKELVEIYYNHDRELLDKGGSHYYETRVICADGVIRDFLFHKATYEDRSGKITGIVGVMLDITSRKEAEKSLTKVEEIRKKEIHHRIKNNLQVISSLLELQAEKFNDIEVLEAFRESQNRVATMAIIHEELYRSKNNEGLDFSAYLQKLTTDLFHSYTVRKEDVNMQLDIEEVFLGMDTAIPLGIIINELVSNSLKHAFPSGWKGDVCIKLCRTEGNDENKSISNIISNSSSKSSVDKNIQYILVVSDNGLGFPENVDFRNTSSLGLQLVNILVEQLDGTIELEKSSGTKFKIWFKESYQ